MVDEALADIKERSMALVTVGFRDQQAKDRCMKISESDRDGLGITRIAHYRPDEIPGHSPELRQRRVYFYNNFCCPLSQEQIHEVAKSFADGSEVHVQPETYGTEIVDGTQRKWVYTTSKTDVLRKGYIEFAEEAHADNLFGALGEEEHPRYGRSQVLSQSYLRQFGVRNAIAFQRDKDYVAP